MPGTLGINAYCGQDCVLNFCRAELSTRTSFADAESFVYHMEFDLLNPGPIIYTDFNAILTTDGIESILIAGTASFNGRGYKNGAGSLAVFDSLRGFLQLSKKEIIVVDWGNSCLRMIERPMNMVSDITKPCTAWNGQVGPFLWPNSVVKDKRNLQKLFVTERRAIRRLTLNSWEVSTFFESAQIEKFKHLVQDGQGGYLCDSRNSCVQR